MIEIHRPATPSPADRDAILAPLIAYNEATAGPANYEPVALLLRDAATGETLGGLWARIAYEWMFVELLVVPDDLRGRGVGSDILARAEAIARAKGCTGIWLDTYGFQAPGFYRKQGYDVFGTLDHDPAGGTRVFLRKTLIARLPKENAL